MNRLLRAAPSAALLLSVAALLGCPPNLRRLHNPVAVSVLDEKLVAQLASPYSSERARAAFALGQLGVAWDPRPVEAQEEASRRLTERLYVERDADVRVEIVGALGRVGRSRGRHSLLAELETPGPARLRAGFALCHLYRRLGEEIDPTTDLHQLEVALVAPEADMRAGVVCALAEMKRPAARPLLLRRLTDGDGRVRAYATSALVTLGLPDDVPVLRHLLDDTDERAAAAAGLALAQLVERGQAPALAVDTLLHALPSLARPATVIALANAGLQRVELARVFGPLSEQLARSGQPRLACLAALAHDRAAAKVELIGTCGGDVVTAVERDRLVARMLGETDPKRVTGAVDRLLSLAGSSDRQVRVLVATALGRYDEPRSRARLRLLIDDREPSVWSSAAESASLLHAAELGPALLARLPRATADQPPVIAGWDVDASLSLIAALRALRPDGAAPLVASLATGTPAAIAFAARDASAALGGAPVIAKPMTPRGPYDDLALPDGAVVVRLETARGVIRIDVRHDVAPRTARNFIGLVRKGFYDGLDFHRIVPGFVAQGGDPNGDGSGGADHVIACEPNPLAYVEGTVGMALSGLDTGSSQFFIALAPAPRLEGRYTAFGQVVDGMAVARALEPGDRILRATIEPPTQP